jgi:hypothetical protein
MKIAFLTHHDPHHRRSWSGILFYMIRTLEEHCGQVVSLGPVGRGWIFTGKVVSRAVRVLHGENIERLTHDYPLQGLGVLLPETVLQNVRPTLFLLRLPQPRSPS